MGFTPHSRADEVVRHGFRQVVYDQASAECLARQAAAQNATAAIHVKIETGTYRLGVAYREAMAFLRYAGSLPHLQVEGIYTHFATAEDTADDSYLQLQHSRFAEVQAALERAEMDVPYQHMAATAAAMVAPVAHGSLVRFGIGLYGLWPSLDTQIAMTERAERPLTLRPVMQWKTRIVHVQHVARGETVGYGRTHRTRRDSVIAVIPIGYSDGYDRKLSNQGEVVIRHRHAPIVGRVMMNMTMIDVTDFSGVHGGRRGNTTWGRNAGGAYCHPRRHHQLRNCKPHQPGVAANSSTLAAVLRQSPFCSSLNDSVIPVSVR